MIFRPAGGANHCGAKPLLDSKRGAKFIKFARVGPASFRYRSETNGVAEGPNAGFGALLVMEFDRDPIRLAFDWRPGGRAP